MIHPSTGYELITQNDINEVLIKGWKNPLISLRQRELTEQQLQQMYKGRVNSLFSILEECVKESYI